jgi:hypothetical protein
VLVLTDLGEESGPEPSSIGNAPAGGPADLLDPTGGRITGHMDPHLPNARRLLTDAPVGHVSRIDGIEMGYNC